MRYLPNLLTCSRILLTPYLAYLILFGHCRSALVWSCIAGATDGIDGYVARRLGIASRLGAYLDPIADKFLLTTLYVCFGIGRLAPWWLVWLVIGRDALILSMTAWAMLTTSYRDFPPTFWGKFSTAIQIWQLW
ncbi:MAG: CDP-alcohol phosphatidyltransferase family protein [Bryobacteraceae bacterium]